MRLVYALIILAALCAAVVILAAPAPAMAGIPCGERDKILKHLGENYKEAPVATGLASNGTVLEVLASASGTWTIFITRPNGLSCVVASGEAWRILSPVDDTAPPAMPPEDSFP